MRKRHIFKCDGCGHTLPVAYQIKTKDLCYICDTSVNEEDQEFICKKCNGVFCIERQAGKTGICKDCHFPEFPGSDWIMEQNSRDRRNNIIFAVAAIIAAIFVVLWVSLF